MKLIIAGGREYSFAKKDYDLLDELLPLGITQVVSGKARGADSEGEKWANLRNIEIVDYPAEWNLYGKRAGFLRNEKMAQYADALAVFAGGNGTEDMFKRATKHNLQVFDFRKMELDFEDLFN